MKTVKEILKEDGYILFSLLLLLCVVLLTVKLRDARADLRAMDAQVTRLTLENMALKAQPSPVAPYVRPQAQGGTK